MTKVAISGKKNILENRIKRKKKLTNINKKA